MDREIEATTTPRVGEGYPARSRYKGSVAKGYLEGRIHDPRWQREQDVLEEFLRRISAGSAILDIPLGTGRFIEFYAGLRHTVYGLDVSRDMVAQARMEAATYRASLVPLLGEAERIPLRDDSVDYVVCVRFLNWVSLSVVARILSEFDRVSRKGVLVHIRTRKNARPACPGSRTRARSFYATHSPAAPLCRCGSASPFGRPSLACTQHPARALPGTDRPRPP